MNEGEQKRVDLGELTARLYPRAESWEAELVGRVATQARMMDRAALRALWAIAEAVLTESAEEHGDATSIARYERAELHLSGQCECGFFVWEEDPTCLRAVRDACGMAQDEILTVLARARWELEHWSARKRLEARLTELEQWASAAGRALMP